ncbi:OmpA family protein [Aliikangiella sp. G2MR2-5]|uniref:flagellar protein MotY n=1 Tax=Aliikangiella sp. G2MR2-5 TaxID=2788943 RepID=UPI0018A9395B|nr:OmpA family protein [Aliikangiella sp. G2MR2-5]
MRSTRQILRKSLLAIIGGTISLSAFASFKHYEAPMDESRWYFSGNPIECKLIHNIPMYGDAEFRKIAGRQEMLGFNLGYKRQAIESSKVARVMALSPSWQPHQNNRELGEVTLKTGPYIVKSSESSSWRLLNELEVGRYPTFYYQEFNHLEDQVAVSLSSIGFRPQYDKFLDCLTSLVPYKLNELTKMTLYFDFDRFSVKTLYKERLYALAQYIKYDPSLEVVFIDGYTDSKGSRYYNQKLAERRIDSVKNILQLDGVKDERFKTTAFGEKKPAQSNRTAKGRSLNRRVLIKIVQNG